MEEKQSFLRSLFEKHREIIMYCVFGGVTTLVSWVSFSLCEAVFGLNLYWAGIVSWIIAVSVAFVTNKIWVFYSRSWAPLLVIKEAVTFFGGRAATGLLEIVAVPVLVAWGLDMTLFGVEGLPAKIIISVVIVVLNYFLSKFVSFRSKSH